MPTPSPLVRVSVIVPMYNAERYIANALHSILQEQSIPLEVIVVNDGTTDGSLERLRQCTDPRLRLVESAGCGIAAALNTGLAHAQGEFIARCDADDLYPGDRIHQQVDWLTAHPGWGAVCGGYAAIDAKGERLVEFIDSPSPVDISMELCAGFARTHFCTYLIRTSVLRDLGGFRPYFTTAEDIDLQLRLGEVCPVWYVPSLCYFYRLHKSSITHTRSSIERQFFDEVARQFQQQRQTIGTDDLQRGCPPLPPQDLSRPLTAAEHIQNFLLWRAWCEHHAGQKWQALTTGFRSALVFPYRLSTWRSLAALAMKPAQPTRLPLPTPLPVSTSLTGKPTLRP
ncbi:MAG: glycosyltransferase [Elainella sp. Prado103]|nr:glycosyltransferase [Elainella sp. Prado103]